MTRTGLLAILLGVTVAGGCQRTYQDFTPTTGRSGTTTPRQRRTFEQAGELSGRAVWTAGIPNVPPIRGLMTTEDGIRWAEMPNHFAPRIDPKSKGIADAVVYLKRCADTSGAFPPLTIEQKGYRVQARQGDRVGRIGFVRVGGEIEMSSADSVYHSLRARGAAYFTLPFPDSSKPIKRQFDTPGHVEFTSAAGYFWSAADVFVCEHGHFTTTDADGRFELKNVPPGEYELVAWLRNWDVRDRDRDPETGRIMRVKFAEPFEITRKVTVADGKMMDIEFEFPPTK